MFLILRLNFEYSVKKVVDEDLGGRWSRYTRSFIFITIKNKQIGGGGGVKVACQE